MTLRITKWTGSNGWSEAGIYQDDALVAVVTHPFSGCRLFVYPVSNERKRSFTTRRKAMEAALKLTERTVGAAS